MSACKAHMGALGVAPHTYPQAKASKGGAPPNTPRACGGRWWVALVPPPSPGGGGEIQSKHRKFSLNFIP